MIFKENLFKGKNILVTGASSGIGIDFAKHISSLGASVTGVSRSLEHSDFNKHMKGDSKTINIDFSDSMLHFDQHDFDVYDGVFLSAGVSELSLFSRTKDEHVDKIFDINVLGQIKLVRYLLKKKKINRNASIVSMSSINGTVIGSKGHVLYASTKAALNGFSIALANELSSKGIRVNSIAAGLIRTPMFEKNLRLIGENEMQKYESSYPLGLGECSDISNYSIFLMTDAARWITGQCHVLDGGHTIT